MNRLPISPRQSPVNRPLQASLADLRGPVEASEESLADIRRFIRRPIVRPPLASFPLRQAFEATALMTAQGRLLAADGRPGEAMDVSLDAIQNASTIGREVDCLFGCSRMEAPWSAARNYVPRLSAVEVRSAGRRVDQLGANFPTWAHVVEQMRLDSLMRAREALSNPKSFARLLDLGVDDGGFGSFRNQIVWTFYPKANGYEELAGWWDQVYAQSKLPFHQRGRSIFAHSVVGRRVEPGLVLDVAPTLALAQLRLLRVEIALQEYYLGHRAYPPDLRALKEMLPVVPRDPFSDQDFHYLRTRSGYTLYSVGPNLFDEDGTPFKETSLSRTSAGDLVIRRP